MIKYLLLFLFCACSVSAASVTTQRELNYVGDKNSRHTLHFARVENGKKLPLIVYFHGGGWMQGNKEKGLKALLPYAQSGRRRYGGL